MLLVALFSLKMRLRDGLGAHVSSSELSIATILAISGPFRSFLNEKCQYFLHYTVSKPSISFEMVVKNEDFVILTLTSLFNLLSWRLGSQKRSIRTLWAAFWSLLGLLGCVSWTSWELPWEFLGPSWAAKRPRCLQELPKPPQDLPKTLASVLGFPRKIEKLKKLKIFKKNWKN